jgi:hypothetical protein
MLIEQVKRGGRVIGEIRKLDAPYRGVWFAYVKGKLAFREHYGLLGTWQNKRLAIKAIREWVHETV